jgi:Spy/CpxP family protein refolding chaperone
MKRKWLLVILAALVAPFAFWLSYNTCLTHDCDEITWFTHEFRLSDTQRATILKMKADYEPICASHCERIGDARRTLAQLEQAGKRDSADYTAAQKTFDALSEECRTATKRHVEAIAAIMDTAEGKRYLELVLPQLDLHASATPSGLK